MLPPFHRGEKHEARQTGCRSSAPRSCCVGDAYAGGGGPTAGCPFSAASIVLRGTRLRRRRGVLLTTVFLIEEPERQRDQSRNEQHLQQEEEDRQEEQAGELDEADPRQADGGELQNGLDHHGIRCWGTGQYTARPAGMIQRIQNRARSTPTWPGPLYGCEAASPARPSRCDGPPGS